MPAKAPVKTIECKSLSHLHDELASVQDALSCTETEDTWEAIARALTRFSALCDGNAATYPADLVAALRASSRPINSALSSERTRLSGTATDFLKAAVESLGRSFEPLLPQYFPALLTLCTRANKVFVNRAKECIHAVIEHTQSPHILHYLAESVKDKSVSLRLAAAEAVMLCLNSFNPPDLEKEQRAKEIEAIIRVSAVDANADVRKVGRKMFEAYKILLPGRVQSFTDPLSPTIRKYLDIKAAAVVRSQPPSRPTSSQSARSDTHAPSQPMSSRPHHTSSAATTTTAAVRPSRHARTVSTSSTTSKRPTRTPTPEVAIPTAPSHEPPRRAREEPKRVGPPKLDMPPPDYIPARSADSGPQRPLSATDLYFPHHAPPTDRVPSGPQRIALANPSAPGAPNPVRSGPIRPAMLPVQPPVAADGTERKERIMGGARRVLRLPETSEAPAASVEERPAASGPIRPRVISTSKSTPAVPVHAAAAAVKEREDALRAKKKLASSQGASARAPSAASTTAAVAVAAARHARTASGGAQSSTASARARVAEKAQEKEKAQAVTRKPSSRALASSKPAVPSRAGAAATVTMRERARPVPGSKTGTAAAKSSARDGKVQKTGARSRAGTQEPPSRAQSVSPAEVPLPESPKASTQALAPYEEQTQDPAPVEQSPFVSVDGGQAEAHDAPCTVQAVPTPDPEQDLIEFTSISPVAVPANIPLPSSHPASPHESPAPSPLNEETTISAPIPPTSSSSPGPDLDPSPPPAPEARTPEQQRAHPPAAVAQTPISALVASIERGFLVMRGVPLSPMREEEAEDESVLGLVVGAGDADVDGRVFDDDEPAGHAVTPLFARRRRGASQQALHA